MLPKQIVFLLRNKIVMKKILMSIFILFTVYGFSQSANDKEVKTVAINFYNYLTNEKIAFSEIKKQKNIFFKDIHSYSVIVFDNNDWVIISADKRADPILAYSRGKSYSDSIPSVVKEWLKRYDYYVYNIKNNIDSARVNYAQLWSDLLKDDLAKYKSTKGVVVSPLISTKWGQSESNDEIDPNAYNYYAPSGSGCSHTPAGCPAVAVGQVLKYWEKPECDVFNWSKMPNTLNTDNSNYTEQKKEIANLLRNIGDNFTGYSYDCDGTGCTTDETLYGLKTYLNYPSAEIVNENDYSRNEWKNLLCNELDNDRPILYRGVDYGGHIFVCDGYGNLLLGKKFHFNFGWNGDYDGYYRFSNPIGYSKYQKAIINIYPKTCDNELTIFDFYSSLPFSLSDTYFYNPTAGYIYSSPESITIESNEEVHYKAYNEIVLENFETEEGAEFTAEIVPCSINCDFTNYKYLLFANKFSSKNPKEILNSNDNKINIYPNPGDDQFYLQKQVKDKIGKIEVFDAFGQLLFVKHANAKLIKINLSAYPGGFYFVRYTSDIYNYKQKIIKR